MITPKAIKNAKAITANAALLAMDIAKALEKLNLSSELCINDFFKKGSAGRNIFVEHVVPFLTLDDLLNSAATCRPMNAVCRTYTVGEILARHNAVTVSRTHKMELGKLIMSTVTSKQNLGSPVHRRFVRSSTESFWARLYHPSQIPEIELAMAAYFNMHGIEFDVKLDDDYDWDANADKDRPVLVSAIFGDKTYGTIDVTVILRYLLMKQGNTRLILKRPLHGNQYWYICLFGDPCERVTKKLWITLRSEGFVGTQTRVFREDTPVKMNLRAERAVAC